MASMARASIITYNETACSNCYINKTDSFCDACLRAKQFRKPFLVSDSRASEIFDLEHYDL